MTPFNQGNTCFACPCGKGHTSPDMSAIVDKLNLIQIEMGRPLHITSGYRCPEHNAKVGGAPDSQHLKGTAVDIATGGDSEFNYALVAAAQAHAIPFIEVAPKHIHLDLRIVSEPRLIIGAG